MLVAFLSFLCSFVILYSYSSGVRRNTRPNAFVSIRVSSPDVRAGIEKIQQEMVGKDRRLQSAMVSLDKLHLTLMVLRLESKEEEER